MKVIKHFPLTLISLMMLAVSLGIYSIKPELRLAVIYLLSFSHIMVYMAGMLETKKKPTWMYGVTYFSALLVGMFLDFTFFRSFPLLTIALVLWNSSFMLRHIFFHRWGLLKYRWIEFVSWILGALFLIFFNRLVTPQPVELLPIILIGLIYFTAVIGKHYYDYVQSKDYYFQEAVKVGDKMPHFQLPDEEGKVVDIYADYIDQKKPVLLFFTRGEWCPFCYVMLRSFERHYQLFHNKGIELVSINPDPVTNNKYKKEILNLHYRLLYDPDMEVAKKFGFFLPRVHPAAKRVSGLDKGLPLPAVILVNSNGTILYVSRADEPDSLNPERVYEIITEKLS